MKYSKLVISLLVIALVLSIFFRSFWLNSVPVALSADEMDYVINGLMINLYGSDLSGKWSPWPIQPMITETITSELFAYTFAGIFTLYSDYLHAFKLMNSIWGVSWLLLSFYLVKQYFKSDLAGALTAIFISISPWAIFINRTSYEVNAAITLLLLQAALLYWSSIQKRQKWQLIGLLLSGLALFLGIFSYHGYKLLAPLWSFFWIAATTLEMVPEQKKITIRNKHFFSLALAIYSITAIFAVGILWSNRQIYQLRSGEFLPLNSDYISKMVNEERRISLNNPLKNVLINKYTVLGREIGYRIFEGINPTSLFGRGSDAPQFSFWIHGYLYWWQAFLIVLALYFVAKKNSKLFFSIFILALITISPAALHTGYSYPIRAGMFHLLLIALTGYGASVAIKKYPVPASVLLIPAVLISSVAFFYIYFFRFPIISVDSYLWKERLLSSYLSRLPSEQEVFVLNEQPFHAARAHLFYSGLISKQDKNSLNTLFPSAMEEAYQLGRVNFVRRCDQITATQSAVIILASDTDTDCPEKLHLANGVTKINLNSPLDSRSYYSVFLPSLCVLHYAPFVRPTSIHDFDLESLSDDAYCTTWTTNF